MTFNKDILTINCEEEEKRITSYIKEKVQKVFHRRGAVVGISGGVDSSVVLALLVKTFGTHNVTAIMMPEKDSSRDSIKFAQKVAGKFGVTPILEDITSALEGIGCYQRRDDAVRRVYPDYDPVKGDKVKLVLPSNLLEKNSLNIFSLVLVKPDGEEKKQRLNPKELLQIIAASNYKQRTRMATLYYHAELRNYAVIGTANKNEHDQGFFVKYGDGGVDIQAIVHLYKSQVYQMARHLDIPEEIIQKPPTSDTYSAPQTQEEFFFRLPFDIMDLLWYAYEEQIPIREVANVMNLEEEQVKNCYNDFVNKINTTKYLRYPPLDVTDNPI